jgi:hypothetical protein
MEKLDRASFLPSADKSLADFRVRDFSDHADHQ